MWAGLAGVPFEGLSSLYTPGAHGGLSRMGRHSFCNFEESLGLSCLNVNSAYCGLSSVKNQTLSIFLWSVVSRIPSVQLFVYSVVAIGVYFKIKYVSRHIDDADLNCIIINLLWPKNIRSVHGPLA